MNQVKTRKTGIFSGSFNPIHIGHLALANYLCEYEGLDEIWFMVSPQNPLKTKAELWSDELRLQLVELSISDYPRFRASDFEFHLSRPSYSVYTLEKLRETYPNREILFQLSVPIIGNVLDAGISPKRIIKENQTPHLSSSRLSGKKKRNCRKPCVSFIPLFLKSVPLLIREALSAGKDISLLPAIRELGRLLRKDNIRL